MQNKNPMDILFYNKTLPRGGVERMYKFNDIYQILKLTDIVKKSPKWYSP